MRNKEYFTLLGDVINSRKIKRRKSFDRKFTMAISQVTQLYKDSFKVAVKKWKGIDEVAAIIDNPAHVYELIRDINEFIYPQKIRFVLAKGEIEMKPGVEDISELDGNAFHEASSLMAELKKSGDVFASTGNNEMKDVALTNQVNALFLLKERWTEKQILVYKYYYTTLNQEAVAKKFKITQQSVSKTLKAINAVKIIELEKKVIAWIASGYI